MRHGHQHGAIDMIGGFKYFIGGGFKYFLFSPLFGKDLQFDSYISS